MDPLLIVFCSHIDLVGGFSITSTPAQLRDSGTLELAIKSAYSNPIVRWLHNSEAVGATVQFRVGGDFYLSDEDEAEGDVILIAGGVGATPMISMAMHLAERNRALSPTMLPSAGPPKPGTLPPLPPLPVLATTGLSLQSPSPAPARAAVAIFSARNTGEILLRRRLTDAACDPRSGLELRLQVTRQAEADPDSEPEGLPAFVRRGRVDAALLAEAVAAIRARRGDGAAWPMAYMCGPPVFEQAVLQHLDALGFPPDRRSMAAATLRAATTAASTALQPAWRAAAVEAWVQDFATGAHVGLAELDRSVFGAPVRKDLLARAIRYEQVWRLAGTESTKTRGLVRGTTKKPFPQKGRGAARQGSLVGPHYVGGYVSHGPRPHLTTSDIQKKVYDAAIRSALSAKFAQDQLVVVDRLSMEEESREALVERMRALGVYGRSCLMLYGAEEPEAELVASADRFMRIKKSDALPEGERKPLVASARMVAVEPVLASEYLLLDVTAAAVLESMFCLYPQSLTLRLVPGNCRVNKIQILSHHFKIPTRLEFFLGRVAGPDGAPPSPTGGNEDDDDDSVIGVREWSPENDITTPPQQSEPTRTVAGVLPPLDLSGLTSILKRPRDGAAAAGIESRELEEVVFSRGALASGGARNRSDRAMVSFERLGYVTMNENVSSSFKARELKSVHVDGEGEFLKIVVHKNYINALNLYNQIDPIASVSIRPAGPVGVTLSVKNLAFDLFNDEDIATLMESIAEAKTAAVQSEDYGKAKSLKTIYHLAKKAGEEIAGLQVTKANAIESEDYEVAEDAKYDIELVKSELKSKIAEFGFEITPKGGIKATTNKAKKVDRHTKVVDFVEVADETTVDVPRAVPLSPIRDDFPVVESLLTKQNTAPAREPSPDPPATTTRKTTRASSPPIPTLRGRAETAQADSLDDSADGNGLPEPEPLPHDGVQDLREPIEVHGEFLVRCLLSRKFRLREWALDEVTRRLETWDSLQGSAGSLPSDDPVEFEDRKHSSRKGSMAGVLKVRLSWTKEAPAPSADRELFLRSVFPLIQKGLDDIREKVAIQALSIWDELT
ncbi:hypothetical protein HK405_013691, partial [Cladochytrium tenue]